MRGYLGVDVGSVSTNLVALNEAGEVMETAYLRTRGRPIGAIQQGLAQIGDIAGGMDLGGVGATGSGRTLAGAIIGADVVKNEITAHAVAALTQVGDVRTVIEIGGQDSKLIILQDGVVVDFAMNTVCAAGTGSFLDHQASRLGVAIEDFGEYALESRSPVRIAGRCSVFAESDMVHKQQLGHGFPDIVAGLCEALVRNYLNNVGKGKDIRAPVLFQGGVAANAGIKRAFEDTLDLPIRVPEHYDVMGALGAALLAREEARRNSFSGTRFRGFEIAAHDYRTGSFECDGCANNCEIADITLEGQVVARWGGRCDRWERSGGEDPGSLERTASSD